MCSSRVAMTSRASTSALQVTLVTDSCEVELIEAPAFAAMVVMMLVPFKYNGPAKIMLDEMVAEPLMSIDGALTGQEKTALLAEIPSRSTLLASAKDNVQDDGLIRAQLSSLSCNTEVEPNNACFPAKAEVSPDTSLMVTVVVVDAAFVSCCSTFTPLTVNAPVTVQLPFTARPVCIVAPVADASDNT